MHEHKNMHYKCTHACIHVFIHVCVHARSKVKNNSDTAFHVQALHVYVHTYMCAVLNFQVNRLLDLAGLFLKEHTMSELMFEHSDTL